VQYGNGAGFIMPPFQARMATESIGSERQRLEIGCLRGWAWEGVKLRVLLRRPPTCSVLSNSAENMMHEGC
jgi:hypothetical protein